MDERTAASLYLQMLVHQRSPRKHGADFDWASWQTSFSKRRCTDNKVGIGSVNLSSGPRRDDAKGPVPETEGDFYYCKKCCVHVAANLVIRDNEADTTLCPNCESNLMMIAHNQQMSQGGRKYHKRPRIANHIFYPVCGRRKELSEISIRAKEAQR